MSTVSSGLPPPTSHSPRTDYATYLKIDQLLRLQEPLTPGAHDEMLFIVIHQVYELWFRLLVHELTDVARAMRESDFGTASIGLDRVIEVEKVMETQLAVLETMSPEGFLRFRDPLTPASGLESQQFRELESILTGSHGPRRDGQKKKLPTPHQWDLWEAFRAGAHDALIEVPARDVTSESEMAPLVELYAHHRDPVRAWWHALGEKLIEVDERFVLWRSHHMMMAAREIGQRTGTGGSAGVSYLESTLAARAFPPLWEVRTQL